MTGNKEKEGKSKTTNSKTNLKRENPITTKSVASKTAELMSKSKDLRDEQSKDLKNSKSVSKLGMESVQKKGKSTKKVNEKSTSKF